MNIYLLQLISKWINIIILSLYPSLNGNLYENQKFYINNENEGKNLNIVNEIIHYDTKTVYNSDLPNSVEVTLVEGQNGIIYYDGSSKKTVAETITRVVEKGTGNTDEYVGKITGYGPDCPGCSTVGNVSCRTRNGKVHSLIKDGIYYTDDEYGKMRILAASLNAFPCGTVVQVEGSNTSFFGIVLDTGGSMRQAWNEGRVWMDLAYDSQNDARTKGIISGNNIKYKVKRWGW